MVAGKDSLFNAFLIATSQSGILYTHSYYNTLRPKNLTSGMGVRYLTLVAAY